MIKKLSLYGLCFNLGIAFGYPTQAELEAFLTSQEGKVEVIYEAIGDVKFPNKMVFLDESAKEACKTWYEANVTNFSIPVCRN